MISKQLAKGLIFGCIAAFFYGLNPLFTLPLYQIGLTADAVLFYRFFVASLILAAIMYQQKISFALTKKELLTLLLVGVTFAVSSLTLFVSYQLIEAGIASTILFIYPLLVAIIMVLFFHERLNLITMLAITLVIFGVSLLYQNDNGTSLDPFGVFLVFISALTYAIYIIAVERSPLHNIPVIKLTFYGLLFGSLVFFIRLDFGTALPMDFTPTLIFNVLGLAVFTTIVSLILMNHSIQMIGPTTASIIGALEPITALLVGVLIFNEQMTARIFLGIVLILSAIILTVSGKEILHFLFGRHHYFRFKH
ncbi:membrane protein [Gallibacterium salpingitidis]|uniref:Membrane protein n=1 Tax=Gallibacterium salpingitidis TaxID=505341 RepID=A0A1A7Q2P5_9PAST|nr:GRP family sugar transporter [Gallibacterium salpingitidis]OBW95450.1 membrane protein [Gallibacterium salpingitidis]OBX08514.1 membrane protein [Gallibacterium salpingitidis]OBX11631.1 membrane protein [Gallibacterium salpingitidis]